jgi:hypothetical protein
MSASRRRSGFDGWAPEGHGPWFGTRDRKASTAAPEPERTEPCTPAETARCLADHGRPALRWTWYPDGSLGLTLGPRRAGA